MKRMQKASVLSKAAIMAESEIFSKRYEINLPVPLMNLFYSGRLDGAMMPGMHMIAGPSRHFKSNLSMVALKAFQEQYPEGIIIFYDSEFGSLPVYFEDAGIDTTRILHCPVTNFEEYKFDIAQKLEEIKDDDYVFMYTDSLGNLASKKEVEDAKKGNDAMDMTRAKAGKSISRIITPYLTTKHIWFIGIQHTYDTIEMYSKKVMSGGQGWMLSSHTVAIMGKRQLKEKDEGGGLKGFDFVINAEKNRYIKEKSALPITVTFEGGIARYSGLLDIAVATGFVERPSNRSYTRPYILDENGEPESILWKKSDLETPEFWEPLLALDSFQDAAEKLYSLHNPKTFTIDQDEIIMDNLDIDEETGEVLGYKE
jgi:RecA/RadA recombinase